MKQLISLMICLWVIVSTTSQASESPKQSQITLAKDLQWGYLNPLRGDKSPGATDLWGDRTKNVATGMLVKFNAGFTSPPHVHNVSYRGVVIEGLLHNDDPNAKTMWLPAGSFWTQPAGDNHITAANAQSNLIYLEIDNGPYLVNPTAEQFDNGERPVNIHRTNIVWLSEIESTSISGEAIEVAHLWQSRATTTQGMLLKLNANAAGYVLAKANEFKAVIIQGSVHYRSNETKQPLKLNLGSFFSSNGTFAHKFATEDEAIIYIRTNGEFHAKF